MRLRSFFLAFFIFSIVASASRASTATDSLPRTIAALTDHELEQDSLQASSDVMVPFRSTLIKAGHRHQVPAALLAAVVQEESGFWQYAFRVEPAYLRNKRIKRAASAWSKHHQGIPTALSEQTARSTSFGLMQVMGEVAREQNYDSTYLTSLFDPDAAIDQGALLLHGLLERYGNDTLAAISAYNQGNARKSHGSFDNARYVYRVSVAWKHYNNAFHYAYLHHQSKENLRLAGRNRDSTLDHSHASEPSLQQQSDSGAVAQNNGHAGGIGPLLAGYGVGPRYPANQDLPACEGQSAEGAWDGLDTFLKIGFGIIIVGVLGLAFSIWRFNSHWTRLDNGLSRRGNQHFFCKSPSGESPADVSGTVHPHGLTYHIS